MEGTTGEGSQAARSSERWELLALAGALSLAALGLVLRLGSEPFDHGYLRYAEAAVEMVLSGDWVLPHVEGHPYLHKPPLHLWLIALAAARLGDAPGWIQQVPNALAWPMALGATYAFGHHALGSRRTGLSAALLLATTYEFFALTRAKRIDPLFAAGIGVALVCAYLALDPIHSPVRRRLISLTGYTALAGATLVKGPLALLVFLVAMGTYGRVSQRPLGAFARAQLPGIAFYTVLVAIWPMLLVMRLGLSETFAILRATPLATRHAGPLHYLIKLPLLFLPWTLLLPAWVLALARRGGAGGIGKEGIPDAMRFLLCWMLGVFLPLELSPARHSRYLLPLYPALALGVVAVFVHPQTVRSLTPGSLPVRLRGAGLVALRGALALLGAAAPVAAWSRLPHTPGLLLGSFVLGALLAFASLTRWSWLHDPQRQRFAFEQTLLVATLAFFFGDVASALHYAPLARRDDARRLLAPLVAGAPARCFGLDEDAQSTVLLATWHRVEAVRDPHALASWMAQEPPARRYVVTNPAGAEQLEKALRPALQRVGSVHLSSRTLVLLTGGASGRLPSARGSVTLAPSSEETAARGSPSHARVEALSAKTGGPRRHAVVSSPRSTMGEEGML